jgi:PAS domain S-box-containing protein
VRQNERALPTKMIMLDFSRNWKNVIDALRSGVIVIDTGGAIQHVNPALEGLTGYRAGNCSGHFF